MLVVFGSIAAGVLAGAGADWIAARVAGQRSTVRTSAATAIAATVLTIAMLLHPAHTWHGRLMPLWAWGWLAIADLDLRTRVVYDMHVAALALLALVAAAMDRQLLVSLSGGLVVGGMLAGINGAAQIGKERAWPVIIAAALGLTVGGAAWVVMLHLTPGLPVRGPTDPRVFLAVILAFIPPALAVLLRWMARDWDGELIGWGDVLLIGVMGLWFGLRWVWTPLLVGIGTAALLGACRWVAVTWTEQRLAWLREAQPTVPGLFVGAVLGLMIGGLRR